MPATGLRSEFLTMHVPGTPLVVPNPWDVGSALMPGEWRWMHPRKAPGRYNDAKQAFADLPED